MNFLWIGLCVALVFAGLLFIATENFLNSLILFLVTIGFLFFVTRRQVDKYQEKTRRYHQCFQFINTYLVSLSIKGSLSYARESSYNIMDKSTREVMDSIKDLDEQEQLSYLCKYFKFDLHHLFIDTVSLWNEQGGDILNMSQYLVNRVRLKEEYLLACQATHRSRLVEFVILWSITLLILVGLRFALSQFYAKVVKTTFYQIAILSIFLFIIVSIYIMVSRISNVTLEGWKDDEK